MTEEQMKQFLETSLQIDNPELKDAIIKHVMEKGWKEGYQGWEQLRFIKRQFDILWGIIKKCSEQQIVHERVDQMVKALPRPTIK